MVFDDAIGTNTTRSRAWVNTLLVDTSLVTWAVAAGYAFGSTGTSVVAG